jgi:hypothetical protein
VKEITRHNCLGVASEIIDGKLDMADAVVDWKVLHQNESASWGRLGPGKVRQRGAAYLTYPQKQMHVGGRIEEVTAWHYRCSRPAL